MSALIPKSHRGYLWVPSDQQGSPRVSDFYNLKLV